MDAKDFDATRNGFSDRPPGFIIGGVTFRVVWGVSPELVYGWEDTIREERSSMAILEANDRLVAGYLHPDDREAWRELRARTEDPVTKDDIWALINWLRETDVGRPTTPPASSASGAERTPVSSADA